MAAVSRCREASWLRRHCLWLVSLTLLLAVIGQAAPVYAGAPDESAEEEEPSPYRGGLIARYTGTDGISRVRLEDEIAFAWGAEPPERRVPPGPSAECEYLIEESLTHLEVEFGERFIRLHRNCLVAPSFIAGYEKRLNAENEQQWVALLKGISETIAISRRQQHLVREA